VWCGLDSSGSGEGPVTGSFQHGDETSVSLEGWEFRDELSDYQLPIEDCAPRSE
jgi:hypothetical protein